MVARILHLVAFAAATAALCPTLAFAVEPQDVLLGFGASYTAPDGSPSTHRGIDVAADSGSAIDAPATGTVRFAGRVPGPHGGTVAAVTLETDKGLVSMLPLEDVRVQKGEHIERGEPVGSVAPTGDPSSSTAHVHLSLRLNDLYVDPTVLLVAPPAPKPKPAEQPEPVHDPEPAPVGPAPVAVPTAAPSLSSSPAQRMPGYTGSLSAELDSVRSPQPSFMGEGVSLTSDAAAIVADVSEPGVLSRSQITADISSTERLSRIALASGEGAAVWLRSAGTSGFAAIAMGSLACIGLLGKQAFERRVASNPPVSDRLGRMLQQLRAGDTLRGLTSCSGLLPSQSRSRIAQRR